MLQKNLLSVWSGNHLRSSAYSRLFFLPTHNMGTRPFHNLPDKPTLKKEKKNTAEDLHLIKTQLAL